MLRSWLYPQPHSNIIVPLSYLQVFEGNATSDKQFTKCRSTVWNTESAPSSAQKTTFSSNSLKYWFSVLLYKARTSFWRKFYFCFTSLLHSRSVVCVSATQASAAANTLVHRSSRPAPLQGAHIISCAEFFLKHALCITSKRLHFVWKDRFLSLLSFYREEKDFFRERGSADWAVSWGHN